MLVLCVCAEEKIARVSGADLDLFEHSLTLEIRGTDDERKRAKKYVECVMAQRIGPVTIEENSDDDDLTVIMVPSEAVGFVTGAGGNFLRQVEEEWGTLMFFADFRGRGERQEVTATTESATLGCVTTQPCGGRARLAGLPGLDSGRAGSPKSSLLAG